MYAKRTEIGLESISNNLEGFWIGGVFKIKSKKVFVDLVNIPYH